jgi:hypothetical protein
MKLTIEIPDEHMLPVMKFVSDLMRSRLEEAETLWAPLPEIPGENIAAADPLKVAMDDPVEDNRPRLIPLPGKSYRTRHGVIMHCREVSPRSIECHCVHGCFFYQLDGTPRGGGDRQWDCVEEVPF